MAHQHHRCHHHHHLVVVVAAVVVADLCLLNTVNEITIIIVRYLRGSIGSQSATTSN